MNRVRLSTDHRADRYRWRRILLLVAGLLLAPGLVRGGDGSGDTAQQQDRIAQMVGRGVELPGGCRFSGGGVNPSLITAEYQCAAGAVLLELRHADDAPSAAIRTEKFALVVGRGLAPPALLQAVATRLRAEEASINWEVAGRPDTRMGARTLLAAACVVVFLTLAVQVVVVWRRRGEVMRIGVQQPFGAPTVSPAAMGPLAMAALGGLVVAYLIVRMTGLTHLPVFVDEAFHIDWARDSTSLAKQIIPGKWLPVQIMGIAMLLPGDPLFTARAASVLMGLAALLSCVFINRELFAPLDGLVAGLIYLILPFAVFYDRLALADLYVTAFGAWAVLCSIATMTRSGAGFPLATTLCLSAAILSKPTGAVLLGVPPLIAVLLCRRGCRAAYMRLLSPAVLGNVALVGLLLMGEYGTGLVQTQSGFDPTRPFALVLENGTMVIEWFTILLTPSIALAALLAVVWASYRMLRGRRAEAFLVAVFALTIGPYVLLSTKLEARYLLFATVPTAALVGRAIAAAAAFTGQVAARISRPAGAAAQAVVLGACVALLVYRAVPLDVAIVNTPESAPIPVTEHLEYVATWSSGYGLPELATFLRQQGATQPIDVIRFKSGPADEGLNLYLSPSNAIRLHSVDNYDVDRVAHMIGSATDHRTFFVSNGDEEPAQMPARARYVEGARPVWSFSRPGGESEIHVWELQPTARAEP